MEINMAKNILQLDCNEAREFFLQEESYNTIKFPPYIKFDSLIQAISGKLKISTQIYKKNEKDKNIYSSEQENVNYKLFNNKDGKYSWRLFQLIHPVLYVNLVHQITEDKNWNDILSAFENFKKTKGLFVLVCLLCHQITML
jgi:glycosyltransferase involved in cell wall biosynthesis